MSSWQYLESKDIWGLRRVRELHIGKMRPFLFIISVAPSLGPLICLKSPFFNFRSAKLPYLVHLYIKDQVLPLKKIEYQCYTQATHSIIAAENVVHELTQTSL